MHRASVIEGRMRIKYSVFLPHFKIYFAVEVVKAEMFMSFKTVTNLEFLESKAIELCNELMKNDEDFQESVSHALFFKNVICSDPDVKSKYFKMFKFILKSFNFGDPKERYTALTGGFNCGKTSIGFAFLTLFSGTSINCNVDFGRIGFFLGEAINQRFILFDDVSKKGMKNLDELRDHLDGRVPVLLEKKNMQPLLQKFPAGIITSNLPISSNLHVRKKAFRVGSENMVVAEILHHRSKPPPVTLLKCPTKDTSPHQ
ncbi:Large T antigen, partial [Araneus ventricosus]